MMFGGVIFRGAEYGRGVRITPLSTKIASYVKHIYAERTRSVGKCYKLEIPFHKVESRPIFVCCLAFQWLAGAFLSTRAILPRQVVACSTPPPRLSQHQELVPWA